MKITGTAKVLKDLLAMQDVVMEKIDNIDWDKTGADEKDEKLNETWDCIETAIEAIREINDI